MASVLRFFSIASGENRVTVNAGSRPVGATLGAVVGAHWGEAACLWLALAGFGLQAWIIFASSLAGLRRLPAPAV